MLCSIKDQHVLVVFQYEALLTIGPLMQAAVLRLMGAACSIATLGKLLYHPCLPSCALC